MDKYLTKLKIAVRKRILHALCFRNRFSDLEIGDTFKKITSENIEIAYLKLQSCLCDVDGKGNSFSEHGSQSCQAKFVPNLTKNKVSVNQEN